MPSPVGHALGAVACGWLVAGAASGRRTFLVQTAILAGVGMAPDLDLLIGRHSAETHSIGAAVLVATVAAVMRWPVARTRTRIWWAVAIAWTSHPLLDALGSDGSAPFGVMMFWPFSRDHIMTSLHLFDPITRRWWLPGFVAHNLLAAAREIILLGPVTWGVWIVTRHRGPRRPQS